MQEEQKQIKNIVFRNGLELIGYFSIEIINGKSTITLSKPFQLTPEPMEGRREPRVFLSPYQVYSTLHESLPIRNDDVMFIGSPTSGLEKQYKDMFSNIMRPTTGLITGSMQ